MRRKWKRAAAAILTAAMIFGQCQPTVLADEVLDQETVAAQELQSGETQTEPQNVKEEGEPAALAEEPETKASKEKKKEPETQAPTEKATEAPTEKVTEAQTEKATEAPTEKATEAPTEKATEAPTEKATEAPTEKATEAPTEKATETPTEKATEAPTEKATEAPTEKATEAPTEKATEAPTEPETQSPTEKATETPTEPETQAPTEKETEAPTEKETEAPTEKATEAPTEKETQSPTEKETTTEKETERSDRKNDGKKITDTMLETALADALPYLFAGETVELPEGLLEENLADSLIADDEEGRAITDDLADLSKKLANGKSSSMVKVINVYADEDGELDEKQFEKAYKNQIADVTDQYLLVNVIAAKKDQTLQFSGYPMVIGGKDVIYDDMTQPGDVLYNFAALDGEKYQSFEGTLELSSPDGLQGTFLAPKAEAQIKSDLAGAVYANEISVSEKVENLMRIVLIRGAKEDAEEETESESEPEQMTEAAEETESESEPEQMTEAAEETESESEPEQMTEAAEETEGESETELLTEVTEETESESEPEQMTEAAEETESESEPEQVTEAAEETEELFSAIEEPETGAQIIESELFEDMESDLLVDTDETVGGRKLLWYSKEGTQMQVGLADAQTQEALAGGNAAIKAAEQIYGEKNEVVCRRDALVQELNWKKAELLPAVLHYGGSYYLELTAAPKDSEGAEYLKPLRIYFRVSGQGYVELAAEGAGYTWKDNTLQLQLTRKAQASVSLVEQTADGYVPLAGPAAFVIKDAKGQLLRDANGSPRYYISYADAPVSLYGLEPSTAYLLSQIQAPEGYQMSADVPFTTPASEVTEPVSVQVADTRIPEDGKTLRVSLQTSFNGAVLTAEQEQELYTALFADPELKTRISGVKTLNYTNTQDTEIETETETGQKPGTPAQPENRMQKTTEAVFDGIAEGIWYIGLTDAYGEALKGTKENPLPYQVKLIGQKDTGVTVAAADKEKQAVLDRAYTTYPSGVFSHQAELRLTVEVKDNDGNAKKTEDTFYLMLSSDEEGKKLLTRKPIALEMKNASALTASIKMKMTEAFAELWITETDKDGSPVAAEEKEFAYAVTYPTHSDRKITVSCGVVTNVTVRNQLNPSIVKLRVEDAQTGALLKDAKLALKNPKTGKVISINNTDIHTSKENEIIWKKFPAGTYRLTEITAPTGYANTADAEFTVEEGKTVTVTLKNEKLRETNNKITVVKQVYSEEVPVYARDLADGTFAAKGSYTFYAALFSDVKRTQKVSDVQEITVSALSGTTEFQNLTAGATYYLAETDKYGTIRSSSPQMKVRYSERGEIAMTAATRQAVIQNAYASLPEGYRYTATLTITKKLQKASGEPENAAKTFYAGIYRKADYSDQPTIVPLVLENTSEAAAKRRILLSGSNDAVYYIAEVDENGSRITDKSAFPYTVSIDQPQVTLKKGSDLNVTITNRTKITKVTLYLTKKVYESSAPKKVNETFYAGLFKDKEFTQLYANPIPLQLKDKSEITLKLSLNLGAASEATIYVAEVDQNGKVVKSGKDFGYDIRVVNAAAAFTQERTEIQSILLNSVYGTVNGEDWNQIMHSESSNMHGDMGGGAPSFSWNGSDGDEFGGGVQTGDDTPILVYAAVLVISAAVLIGVLVFGRRKKKHQKK